jgi:outer membrane murein-binding lipoprotein Lpp
MSEENTQNLPDTRSFEERVFARFDAIDAGLRDLNARVERLEAESERRAVDTKPIWERALAEIIAVGQKVDALEARVAALEVKVDALQEEVAVISRKVNVIESRTETFALDMFDLRVEQRELKKRINRLDSENAR